MAAVSITYLANEAISLLCIMFVCQIQDMVMIRHAGSSTADLRTTLILLCEDGSLRIYMASVDHTNFWMVPTMQPGVSLAMEGSATKLERKKKLTQTGKIFVLCHILPAFTCKLVSYLPHGIYYLCYHLPCEMLYLSSSASLFRHYYMNVSVIL